MEKDRLAVFGNRVFVIVSTLLILDICLPHTDSAHLVSALKQVFAEYHDVCAYFLLVGIHWAFHHYYFDQFKKVHGTFIVLNTFLLLSFKLFIGKNTKPADAYIKAGMLRVW
jgi:uncharacterized membrane protein